MKTNRSFWTQLLKSSSHNMHKAVVKQNDLSNDMTVLTIENVSSGNPQQPTSTQTGLACFADFAE